MSIQMPSSADPVVKQLDVAISEGGQSLVMLHGVSLDSSPVTLLFHMVSQRIQLKSRLLGQFLPVIIPLTSSFPEKAPLLSLQHVSSSFPKPYS